MFSRDTILIVDDEPVVRALLHVALEPAGARLVEAADGSEALEAAWREHPAVVVLDVGLPKLSGMDVCRALKTNPEPPHVILITGDALLDEIEGCGADRVVAKPFAPTEVLAAVRETRWLRLLPRDAVSRIESAHLHTRTGDHMGSPLPLAY